ncbi:LacI family DNA-binding transcriptional regulator [Enterobacter chuandaensis]|uniref:LacI family DNA-binding transcriptional regulator n=2 Tax=Enterobacter chuandaensis TaxID=2497875 RepID=A0AA96LY42_9ENTR|nr:LacI family DNA-binding transcriptional regulator [Enterobacter chuandaensis]OQD48327.1 LacI family transcriptional regulator [Enterobacter cancerogenus]MCM7588172.1 LacI family transcriptional regulator [Enterobacter chuandaensis]MCW4780549.1 LacI family transcriptional regulator [Enterobacter chuandaensis]MDA4758398.1 LacI family transcriptional regulator [Enterobacter chuandaensis]RJL02729.1 LacI family transcriptional regulator [Enterobacter chuandaensis]
MSPTIYDIARVAGVSKSTVSRVLNKQTNISPEARDKVLKAIDELNYQPNKLARALTSSGFDAIMVISTRSTKTTAGNPFFSDVLHAITAKAEEEGFDVILQTSKSSEDDLLKCVSKIKQKMIKGIIMLSSPANESFFTTLDEYGVPVVVIGKVEGEYQNIYSVDTDNFQDSAILTESFIKHGRTKIACLHAPLDYHVSIDRLAGYKSSLEKQGIAINPEWVIDGGYTHESALQAACKLLSSDNPPDAVFATDSMKLLGLYRAADELNLKVPEQVAMAGYSDPMLSLVLTPAPGGFDIPTRKLGEESCNVLFKRIAGNPAPHKVLVETHFSDAAALR